MANRFQKRRVAKLPLFVYGIALLICALTVFELYSWIMPFHSQNPLYHEVTIGESVIQEWKYGGQDEEGYLRFYNGQQTVVLPPNARMFDADGQFVVIERFTPSSLTYAMPLAAIPFKWMVALIGVAISFLVFVRFKLKHHHRKMRKSKPIGKLHQAEGLQRFAHSWIPHARSKRFQTTTKKAKWKPRAK